MAFGVASLLLLSACAPPQNNTANVTPESSPSAGATPSPSPTPPGPLELTSAAFHNGEIGLAYAGVTLQAAGGTPPYTWTVPALPPGLSLGSDGSVTGTPTKTGTYSITATVADSAGSTASRRVGVTVYPAMRTTQVCSVKCQIGAGCTRCGGFGTVAGGLPPYRYAVVGGSVPQGMTWKALSLSGPFPAGAFNLHVQVSDALGAQTTVVGNWVIYKPAVLTKGGDCSNNFTPPVTCSATWGYSGGNPFTDPTFVIVKYSAYCTANGCDPVPTSPPPGWSVTVKNGTITMSASSPPSVCVSYNGYITFALRDQGVCATTAAPNAGTILVNLNYSC